MLIGLDTLIDRLRLRSCLLAFLSLSGNETPTNCLIQVFRSSTQGTAVGSGSGTSTVGLHVLMLASLCVVCRNQHMNHTLSRTAPSPASPTNTVITMHHQQLHQPRTASATATSRPPAAAASRFLNIKCCHRRHTRLLLQATPHESSEFDGVEGNEVLQEALMQQLRVQIETQTLKEEIKEDLKGKTEEMKQIGEEVRHTSMAGRVAATKLQPNRHVLFFPLT